MRLDQTTNTTYLQDECRCCLENSVSRQNGERLREVRRRDPGDGLAHYLAYFGMQLDEYLRQRPRFLGTTSRGCKRTVEQDLCGARGDDS